MEEANFENLKAGFLYYSKNESEIHFYDDNDSIWDDIYIDKIDNDGEYLKNAYYNDITINDNVYLLELSKA